MTSIRKHLNYANVVATLALLFAMSGGALAASHYLINSTAQINPQVLKKLRGHSGKGGQAPSVLPSGQSESGDYGLRVINPGTGGGIGLSVSFPIPLATRIRESSIEFVNEFHGSGPHCPGAGHADRGYLCIYEKESNGIAASPAPAITEWEDRGGPTHNGSGNFGFNIVVPVLAEKKDVSEYGTFTVSAP
jgi:hypothetical protein